MLGLMIFSNHGRELTSAAKFKHLNGLRTITLHTPDFCSKGSEGIVDLELDPHRFWTSIDTDGDGCRGINELQAECIEG
jgi:hypothetical protein